MRNEIIDQRVQTHCLIMILAVGIDEILGSRNGLIRMCGGTC